MNKHVEIGDELEPTAIQRAKAGDSRLMQFMLTFVTSYARSRLSLQAENAALRDQLFLYLNNVCRPKAV